MKDLQASVRRLAQARVLVVGDVMLDQYVFGRVDRVSPEAPVPVLAVESELSEPGGAGNVVHNLCALGASVAFVSVVGDDRAGAELTGLIGGQKEVEPWLLVQGGRVTTVKTRFVASGTRRGGHHLLRTDREDRRPIHPKLADRLARIAHEAMAATTLVVLSDYRKGVLGGGVAATLIAAAKASGRRIIADLRAADWSLYAGADVIVPHARDVLGEDGNQADLAAATQALRAAFGFGAALVKCGDAGFLFADDQGEVLMPLVPADPVDLSGAGDAAVATFAAALATGADLRRAATLATVAAGVIGAVPGSALARPEALIAALGG